MRKKFWPSVTFGLAGLLLAAMPSVNLAQQPTPQGPLHQAYQQQLQENQRRLANSNQGYAAQVQHNHAAQTYMPPVHIAPQFSAGNTGDARSLNGRFNTVQNYAAPAKPTFAQLGDQQSAPQVHYAPPVHNVPQSQPRPVAAVQPQVHAPRAAEPAVQEHVFLQDRIASALSKRFRKPTKQSLNQPPTFKDTPVFAPEFAPLEPTPAEEMVAQSQPSLESPSDSSSSLVSEQPFESKGEIFSQANDSEPHNALQRFARRKDKPANHSYDDADMGHSILEDAVTWPNDVVTNQDSFVEHPTIVDDDDDDLGAEIARIDREFAETMVKQSSFAQESTQLPYREKVQRVARNPKRKKTARPITYRPTQNRLRASEVSILVGQEEEDLPAEFDQFDIPLESGADSQRSLSDDDLASPLRAGSGSKTDSRDIMERLEEMDLEDDDRVRSKLDELDDMDDLADIDDEDLDDDLEDEVGTPRVRPCNEFADELLADTVRKISLDISPPAYSSEAILNGPSREWTDRSGNVIANGTMVDLRRGYVILASGQKLPYSRLGVADLAAVSKFWRLPTVCLLGNRGGTPFRAWTPQVVTWKASSLCHKPLYFENVQLERYGHSRGPFAQPIHSTLHFFTSLATLPYQMAISPPTECEYALGYYRPGDCAPWLKDPVPISLRGAARQALFTTGTAFIP